MDGKGGTKRRGMGCLRIVMCDFDQIHGSPPFLFPHDRGCILRVWREGGLWSLLDAARGDLEVQRLVAGIHARLDESNGQGVDGVKA